MRQLCCVAVVLPLSAVLNAGAREVIDLNAGWRYAESPIEGATAPDYHDGAPKCPWQQIVFRTVDLPHDMQFERPWDRRADAGRGFKAMAEGVYSRRLFADPAWKGRRVAVDFGGIMSHGEVYLNGDRIASSDYGYLGFEVDVADRLRWGETNLLAVTMTSASRAPQRSPGRSSVSSAGRRTSACQDWLFGGRTSEDCMRCADGGDGPGQGQGVRNDEHET